MLNPQQLHAAQYAILDSFAEDEFERLLRSKLDIRLQYLVSQESTYSEKVFEILRLAERAGWTRDLVRAVYEVRPQRVDLAALYQELGLAPPMPDPDLVAESTRPRPTESRPRFFYPDLWRDRLSAIERQVCMVEFSPQAASAGIRFTKGTGFLVGPDLVLTCSHLLESVLDHRVKPDAVRCVFDYRTTGDGTETPKGMSVRLHARDWLLDYSPVSNAENRGNADALPTPDELDFALVRLERPVGLEELAGEGRVRGWVRVPLAEPRLRPDDPMAIVQHPLGGPLRMSLNTQAIIGYNANRTRLRYLIDAEPGAAGSPCFDTTWNLIAVHHYVDKDRNGQVRYRQGIPIAAIRDRLARVGRVEALGGDVPAIGDEPAPSPLQNPPPPGLVRHADDIQKERWGGESERDGRRVVIEFLKPSARLFTFDAVVESTDGTPLEGPVRFHLHDTFPQPLIQIRKIHDGSRAVLEEVTAYGAFTIGVQVKNARGVWIGLEYDLTSLPDLPAKFRGR